MTSFTVRNATHVGRRLAAVSILGLLLSVTTLGATPTGANDFQPDLDFAVESGSITFIAMACPEVVALGVSSYKASLGQLADNCDYWTGKPIKFTRNHGFASWSQTTGSVLYSSVYWGDVPLAPTAISFTETIPKGWGTPRVFCDLSWSGENTDSQDYSEFPVVNSTARGTQPNSIAFALTAEHDDVLCRWYNIPGR